MLLLKCQVFNNKKSRFLKQKEDSGLLSSLRIKGPVSKILAISDISY